MRISPIIAAGVCAVSFGGSSMAEVLDPAESLTIEVSGTISPVCMMGDIADVNFGDLSVPGKQVRAHVPLYCNVPFDMSVTAQHGGLAHNEMPLGQGPYDGTLGYEMSVRIPVRAPAESVIFGRYTSTSLRAGQILSSGDGVAFDGADIHIGLDAPSGAGLLAGQYSETITIQLSPKV